jgi:hypothetical protein
VKSGRTNQTEPAPRDHTEEIPGPNDIVKVAVSVTALAGIVNWQGLLEEPPEQDAPLIVQLEKCQLVEGVAVTGIDEPTSSLQPLGQFGETEPEPATLVVKV